MASPSKPWNYPSIILKEQPDAMPLEIRELVIKVTIEEENAAPPSDEKALSAIKRAIIRECVEEVLIRLEKRAER